MKFVKFIYLSIAGMIVVVLTAASDTSSVKFNLDSTDLEARGQLKQLKYFESENAIKLDDMFLIEDDAPAIGKPKEATDRAWFEKLYKGLMIRKDIVLDDPRVFSGYLLFNGLEMENNNYPLHIKINGIHFIRPPSKYAHPFAKQYYTREWAGDFDNWFFVKIPVGALKKGTNEIILWAVSEETSWEIMVSSEEEYQRGSTTRIHHPNRSTKSRDGGKTWDFEKLGWKDELDGEYTIRLSLDRYVPEGIYISPVIDIAEGKETHSIKELLSVLDCLVTWDIEVPEETGIEIYARLGESPVPSSNSWSEYEDFSNLTRHWKNPPGRYLQFKIVMKTENPLVTPTINGLSVETTMEMYPIDTNVFCRIKEFRNGQVVRPSVAFIHEDYKKLKEYRERFELDKVVEGAATEFEAQLRLMRWAYEIPINELDPYAWDYYDLPMLKKDAEGNIILQKDYTERRRDKHCLFSNLTLIGACLAMGYPARWVNIATRSTYGHEVTEVWSNDFNKWIFLDATRDYYIYDPDTGIPMSLIEINERLKEIMPRMANWEYPIRWQIPSDSLAYNVNIAFREGSNVYSIYDISQGPHLLLFKGQLHTPIRNDFASRHVPVPWRLTSNWGGQLFYGYYNDTFPRKREYSLHTERKQDFNYPLNQSELTLSETEEPGVIRVDVDTETPCFEVFVIRIGDSDFLETPSSSFEWRLHEGLNCLRVRARNSAGISGPESFVSVIMNN